MKFRILGILFVAFSFFLTAVSSVKANYLPSPTGYVNDFAGVLTSTQKSSLENLLQDYEQKTTNEITVAMIKNLNGQEINDFKVKVFEEWKIGKKGKDNGILVLVAVEDRKIGIEVGYGLEPWLTDSQAGEILRNQIFPEFKKGDYYTGLTNGIGAMKEKLSRQTPSTFSKQEKLDWQFAVGALIFLVPFVLYLLAFMARSKSVWLGGVVGGILGFLIGLIASPWFWTILFVLFFSGVGFLLDWILSRNYKIRKAEGRRTDWWGSFGGFSSGGGGGGGFGGFGGGSSGGGGASGSW